MKEIVIRENEAGQRLDKLLGKYLSQAPKSFLYKMLRKKNITLNGKKAEGKENTCVGDVVRIFLSDETYAKFSSGTHQGFQKEKIPSLDPDQIIYEDHHILILNKPAGILSQKANPEDVSVNEQILSYLLKKGELTEEELKTFRPSVCNRLDRNTSGLLIAGKTLPGLQTMSELLRDRSLHKYYQCLVAGSLHEMQRVEGFLYKDPSMNKVSILEKEVPGSKPIVTEYTPLLTGKRLTCLEVLLITGRSHQIRAHLSSIGHPVIGDVKYGKDSINRYYQKEYHLHHQLLHASRMEFPKISGPLSYLSGRSFEAPLPALMTKIMKGI